MTHSAIIAARKNFIEKYGKKTADLGFVRKERFTDVFSLKIEKYCKKEGRTLQDFLDYADSMIQNCQGYLVGKENQAKITYIEYV